MTRKCFNAVDATISDDDGWKLLIDTAMGDVLSISLSAPVLLSLARELELAIPAPMSDPGVRAPPGPMRSSAFFKPRSVDDLSIRMRLVQALAPRVAEGLSGWNPDSALVDAYFSKLGSVVDRLQAIVERAPAKDAAP